MYAIVLRDSGSNTRGGMTITSLPDFVNDAIGCYSWLALITVLTKDLLAVVFEFDGGTGADTELGWTDVAVLILYGCMSAFKVELKMISSCMGSSMFPRRTLST